MSSSKPWDLKVVDHGDDKTLVVVAAKKKPKTLEEADVISQLPDDIICSIMMHLTINEAVRTSILSHRWEKLWYSLPTFQLNWDTVFKAPPPLCGDRKKGNASYTTRRDTSRADCKEDKLIIRMTNLFLDFCARQQNGTELDLCLCFGQEYFQAVDFWVNLALSKKDASDLSFKSFCSGCSRACQLKDFPVLRGGCNPQEGTSSNLWKLHLTGFTLGSNFFTYNNKNMRSLVSLRLSYVQQLPSSDMLLSALPDLQWLCFKHCGLSDWVLDLRPLRRLTLFRLKQCTGVGRILVSTTILAFSCHCSKLISCDLSGLPNVIGLVHHVDGEGLQYMFKIASTAHPYLEALRIATTVNWVKMIPKDIATFCRVERLELWFTSCFEFDTLKMITILKAFPALRCLKLRTGDFGETEPTAAGCPVHIDYFSAHLKTILIGGHIGPVHIELAAFLLEHSAATLRSLTLDKGIMDSRFDILVMKWDEDERQKVRSRLQGLSKAKVKLKP